MYLQETTGGPARQTVNVEKYDGTSWTEVNNVNSLLELILQEQDLGTPQGNSLCAGGSYSSRCKLYIKC